MTKHIYIYSPSGAVRDKAAFKRGVKRLETLGYAVEVDTAALTSQQRFAGDDETRIAAIHRAAASGADVAMISRGGYGITRILPGIQYKALAKSVERGTQFVGFSDFTALQLALLAKTGQTSWAGPAVCDDFGVGSSSADPDGHDSGAAPLPDDIMEDCFNDLVTGQGEGTGWQQLKGAVGDAPQKDLAIRSATLWGGNLAVLSSLVGTPYFPQVKGGILFLEDVAEHPYRIERMLTQLLLSGVLAQQKAVVLGQFTAYKLGAHDKGFKLQSVVAWLRSRIKAPVLTNLPIGHVMTKVVLPVGLKVDLLAQGRDAFLVWGHTH
jgi:muramoyltetrapeptide carboxypeptidase